MAAATPLRTAAVDGPIAAIAGGQLHLDRYVSADPDVVAFVSGADEPVAAVHAALSTGARVLVEARARADTTMVEHAFTQLREQVEATLTATFDPARADSAVSTLNAVMREAGDRHSATTRRLLDPANDDSPLAGVLCRVREQISLVLDAVGRLAEQVAADKAGAAATAAAMERSAVKGFDYEQQVAELVTTIAAERGDVADLVGRVRGSAGSKVGDLVVEVATPHAAEPVRYVLEIKDRRLSLRATLAELEAAAANRDANAAIAVFSRPEHCPVAAPFAEFGDRAIVVLDKLDPDLSALRLACAWARWVAHRAVAPPPAGDGIDPDRHAELVAEAAGKLHRISTIRRNHTLAKKHIDDAGAHVNNLDADLRAILTELAQLATDDAA